MRSTGAKFWMVRPGSTGLSNGNDAAEPDALDDSGHGSQNNFGSRDNEIGAVVLAEGQHIEATSSASLPMASNSCMRWAAA